MILFDQRHEVRTGRRYVKIDWIAQNQQLELARRRINIQKKLIESNIVGNGTLLAAVKQDRNCLSKK